MAIAFFNDDLDISFSLFGPPVAVRSQGYSSAVPKAENCHFFNLGRQEHGQPSPRFGALSQLSPALKKLPDAGGERGRPGAHALPGVWERLIVRDR